MTQLPTRARNHMIINLVCHAMPPVLFPHILLPLPRQPIHLNQAQIILYLGLATETDAIPLAVACVHGWAELGAVRENKVPGKLPDAAGDGVWQRGVQQPITVVVPAGEGNALQSLAGDGELAAAGGAEARGDWHVGPVNLGPRLADPGLARLVGVGVSARGAQVDVVAAAAFAVAAQVEEADAGDVGGEEVL